MNTGRRNDLGRAIMRGPRGGLYVITATGRKLRRPAEHTPPAPTHGPPTNTRGRVIHTGARGGRYVIEAGRKVYKFKVAAAPMVASPPLPAHLKKAMKFNNVYMTKNAKVYSVTGAPTGLNVNAHMNMAAAAYARNPKFLQKKVLPFKNTAPPGDKLKPTHVFMIPPGGRGRQQVRIFYDRKGFLHYVRLNDKPVFLKSNNASHWQMRANANLYNNMVRRVAIENPAFPRGAIPSRGNGPLLTTANLMNRMINRIYGGGRGGRINVSNMTANEKIRVAGVIKEQINTSRQLRNQRKLQAAAARARGNHTAAATAMERYGYFNNSIRAMTRGYRALKPLSGLVTGRAITARTPNRYSPAPAGTENVIMTGNLETPHIVIKVPGAQTLYMNPNSLKGMIKNGTGANLNATNLRKWLRMARRNFPNEPLFRHYINRDKNVTARHIRFSSE